MKHGLLLFFNHPFQRVRVFLEQFYRDRFQEIHVLTPPEGSAENSSPNITYYYQGSYNFGSAFSYLLPRTDLFQEMDWVTVLHDDVITHPAFPHLIEDVLSDRPESLSAAPDPVGGSHRWLWDPRLIARVLFARDPMLGDGNESSLREMKRLYDSAPGAKGDGTRIKITPGDLLRIGAKGGMSRQFLMTYRSMTADFGVPLCVANSDFFIVRRDKFREFCHYSGVLSRCGLFPEVAVPTGLKWMGEHPRYFGREQLDWNYGSFEAHTQHFKITSLESIPEYFERNPQKIAIHPIKTSKLLPST